MTARPALSLAILCLIAAGCGGGEPDLMTLPGSRTPDEFLIVPNAPLETPPQPGVLPPPRPGAPNRADAQPMADAVAALGGNPGRLQGGGAVPAADAGLLSFAGRFGRDPGIRTTLAAEDRAWRQRNDGLLLERLLNLNVYYDAYERQSLDQQAEIERFRRAGIDTPAAPPPPLDDR